MPSTIAALLQDHAEHLDALQERVGHRFRDIRLLLTALVHSSYAFEHPWVRRHNETLEFLGDAVLDLAVGFILVSRFPNLREGKLSRIRAALVNEHSLADMALELRLNEHLLLGRGEESSGGRAKSSILSCAYEALVGALYLDGGHDAALAFARREFEAQVASRTEELLHNDPKSALQEVLQERHNEGPAYILVAEEGPAHARLFTVSASFRGEELGRGQAGSKKAAEQLAAQAALARLHERDAADAGE